MKNQTSECNSFHEQNRNHLDQIKGLIDHQSGEEIPFRKNFKRGSIVTVDIDFELKGSPFDFGYRAQADCLKALKKYGGIVNEMNEKSCLVEFLLPKGEVAQKCYYCKKRESWFEKEKIICIDINDHKNTYKCALSTDEQLFFNWNVMEYHRFIDSLLKIPLDNRIGLPWEHCSKRFIAVSLENLKSDFAMKTPIRVQFAGKTYYFNIGLPEPELTVRMIRHGSWEVYQTIEKGDDQKNNSNVSRLNISTNETEPTRDQERREMRIEVVKQVLFVRWLRVVLENGYYYNVFEDGDTYSVSLYDPSDRWVENIADALGGGFFDTKAKKISEAILIDAKNRFGEDYEFIGEIPFYDE